MQSTFMLMFAAALFGAGMAIAQTETETAPQPKPSRFLSKFEEKFKAADKDGDNALSKSEAEGARLMRVVESFDRLDVNKDGKLTIEEIRALVRARLSS